MKVAEFNESGLAAHIKFRTLHRGPLGQEFVPALQWAKIAKELGTGRAPADCLSWYQRQESAGSNRPWTSEEIEQLEKSCAAHAGKGSFWKVFLLSKRATLAIPLTRKDVGLGCLKWSAL